MQAPYHSNNPLPTQSNVQTPDFLKTYYDNLQRRIPSDSQTEADIKHVLAHGYVILENCFSKAEAEDAKAEIGRLGGKEPESGRNPFEGLKTNRIYSLLNKTRAFDSFATLPRVLALNDYFLDPGYLITAFHTIQINPGEAPQDLHHDDQFCTIPRPRPPLGTAIIVALDDFTPSNGSTRIIPGSHLWSSAERPDSNSNPVPAVCPAGSVIYFLATLWHSGGENRTEVPRKSLTVQYCQPYIRQIENQYLAVDPRRLGEMDRRIVGMLGYGTFRGFIGYVDGLSPLEGARRMIRWLQKPLNKAPPTFARHGDGDSKL